MNDRAARRRKARMNTIKGSRTGVRFSFDQEAEVAEKRAAGGRDDTAIVSADTVWLANSLDHLFAEFERLPPARPIDAVMLGSNFYTALLRGLTAGLPEHESDLVWQMAIDTFTIAARRKGEAPK